MNRRGPCVVLLLLLCAACSHSPSASLLSDYGRTNTLSGFAVCRNYNCAKHVRVALRPDEWAQVRALFSPPPRNASEERARIGQAIAMIETLVGPKAGTANDEAGAAIIRFNREGQLDCIDEAYNTSTYLRFLAADGLLRWHDVGKPIQRGVFFDRWPHNTATVVEHASGASYTVDSWFHANGELPEIVPLGDWLAGWSPPERASASG